MIADANLLDQIMSNFELDNIRASLLGFRPLDDGNFIYRFEVVGRPNSVRYHVVLKDGVLADLREIGSGERKRLANQAKLRANRSKKRARTDRLGKRDRQSSLG